jgi:hypothetical protein
LRGSLIQKVNAEAPSYFAVNGRGRDIPGIASIRSITGTSFYIT